jgi:hypothetical protein
MPDAQYTNMAPLLPDAKGDAVNSPVFAVQQLAGGESKLFGFGNEGTTDRHILEADNGCK